MRNDQKPYYKPDMKPEQITVSAYGMNTLKEQMQQIFPKMPRAKLNPGRGSVQKSREV